MSKPSGIIKATLKAMAAYRFEMAITLIVAPVSLIVFYFLWQAIYLNTGVEVIKGFTFQQLVTYYVISWIVGILVYTYIEEQFRWEIRSGTIVKELLKPFDYLLFNFFGAVGDRAYSVIIEIVPLLIIGFIFFSVKLNLLYLPFFLISVVLAFILNFLFSALIGMSAFWLVHNRGVVKLKKIASSFLSGALLPLSFFPIWFQNVSYFLPFQYMYYVPINIWLARYSMSETLMFLGLQLVWIAISYVLCRIVWHFAMKRLAAVGI